MAFDILFASMPVSDMSRALEWYGRFFDRPPDVIAHEEEVMWQAADGGWVYVLCDEARAGQGLIALAVPDIGRAVAQLQERGVSTGPIEEQGQDAQKALVRDADGNSIAIIQVGEAAGH